MQRRVRLQAALLISVLLMGIPAAAEGESAEVLYGLGGGRHVFEITLAQENFLWAFSIDRSATAPAIKPFIGNMDAVLHVAEIGPVWTVGPLYAGAGLRGWTAEYRGIEEYLRPYWTDASGNRVPWYEALDPEGNLKPGYYEYTELATRQNRMEGANKVQVALVIGGSVERGRLNGSLRLSYAGSGLAWLATVGYEMSNTVVLTAGYRAWPMEHFYSGPVLGVEFRF